MLTIEPLEVASTRRARGRGLLGRSSLAGALWLPGVRSVHTVGMRFALDVAWLSASGEVLRVRRLAPGRVSAWVPASAGVLEAEAGAFARWGLEVGSVVALRATRGPDPGAHGARRAGVDRVNGDEAGERCDGRPDA